MWGERENSTATKWKMSNDDEVIIVSPRFLSSKVLTKYETGYDLDNLETVLSTMDTATATSQLQLSDPLPRRAVADGRCQPHRNLGLALCLFILPTDIHSQPCPLMMLLRDALKRHWGICKVRLENGSEIPLLPARRPRLKKPRACNRCVRLKRACDRSVPCSTCSIRNYECSYERAASSKTSVVSEDSSQAETNGVYQQEISDGVVKAADAMPAVLAEFIDYSLEWLRCEFLPFPVLNFDVWNDIRGSNLHLGPCFDQTVPGQKLTLPFLKRFTESSGIADGFDCGTLAQRRQLNNTLNDSSCKALAAKTRQIMGMLKRALTRTRLCSNVGIEWSPVVERACFDFFSPCNLHRFLLLFWSGWYPNSPIIHKPTFNIETEPPGLIASMAVLGACLSPDSNDCVRAMAWLTPVEEVVFADNILYDDSIIASSDLVGDEAVVWDKLKALHAAYFICIAQNWEGSKEGRQRVRKDRYSRIVSIARSFGLYDLSLAKFDTTFSTQQKWARFILLESMIRLPPRVLSLELNTGLVCPEYQTTLVDASQITPAATGLGRWIWLWQQGDHTVVNSDGYSVENMWKRVGFMQNANEYYHLACAMLERWKLTERQIGDTLAAWAVPL
ncbi:hypothetical protein DER46DRAFT_499371 [Fusarium sp. MPI-SDFR-AT-0072]|nr:hypothetical protein DER46DRAFT_499371 [Fusarium sp. MPI-SDFR-AT-0072]